MKIMINYDFLERIGEVKGPAKVLKLIKREKALYAFVLPTLFSFNLLVSQDLKQSLFFTLFLGVPNILLRRISLENIQRMEKSAENDLRNLSIMLQDLNVKTNYDLLLESYMYEKKYSIALDESKIPYILESKYIMVPTYDYNGDITETSILQEHAVGDKEYVLTLGSPKRNFKLAFSGA